MLICEFLENSARHYPDKVGLVVGHRRLTYRAMEDDSNRLARGLIGNGIQRGDRVGIFLETCPESVLSMFAIWKAGGVVLVLDPTIKAEKLRYLLTNCRAAALISSPAKLQALEGGLTGVGSLQRIFLTTGQLEADGAALPSMNFDELRGGHEAGRVPPAGIDVDLAFLVYTSGSTGTPKGVMLTHLNVVSAIDSIVQYLENTSSDVILSVLPIAFTYGLTQVLTAFRAGATVILERSLTYKTAIAEKIQREKVTGFPMVPTIAALMLQMDLGQWDFSHLRYMTNAAAALPLEHIRKFREILPHVKLYSMHGLTECIRTTYLPPDQLEIRPTSVGRGMPNIELYVADEEGRRVPPGEIGELVVRGSNVMRGYWEMPEETERVLRPGPIPGERVLFSGDLFKTDEEGFLYFVSRKDDIIKTMGEKVSPREVEDVLYRLAGIQDAAVVGVPDPILGHSIKAVVTVQTGVTLDELQILRHCAAHLEDYKVPKTVEFLAEMPKTASGKILKRNLKTAGGVL